MVSNWCSGAVCARLVLDLRWCMVSDLVPDLVPSVCCGWSGHWSDLLSGVDLLVWCGVCVWSGILPGGWYLIWCLVTKSSLVSGIWLGGWSWCLVLLSGLVSGCWFWSGMYYLLVLIWCVMSVWYLVAALVWWVVSSYWSGMVCGARYLIYCPICVWLLDLISCLLSGLVSGLVWCLVTGSGMVWGVWSGICIWLWLWSKLQLGCSCLWSEFIFQISLLSRLLVVTLELVMIVSHIDMIKWNNSETKADMKYE